LTSVASFVICQDACFAANSRAAITDGAAMSEVLQPLGQLRVERQVPEPQARVPVVGPPFEIVRHRVGPELGRERQADAVGREVEGPVLEAEIERRRVRAACNPAVAAQEAVARGHAAAGAAGDRWEHGKP
jgi:hypothetical protein